MMPIIPHFVEESLEALKINENIKWPEYNQELLIETIVKFVVQINGKKRALIEVNRDISENDLMKLIMKNENLKKYIIEENIKKKIFIQNKLINIII